jgi:5-hydroxyisourate hydrolase-like protein (transthyretin family)
MLRRMPKVWHLLSVLLGPFAALAAMAPQDAARLQGRIVHAEGRPVPAAQVEVTPWAEPHRVLQRTRSDGDGMFFLTDPADTCWLRLRAWAADTAVREVWVRDRHAPLIVQLQAGVAVRGTLRDAQGRALAGTRVRGIGFHPERSGDRYATTDADGRFTLTNMPLGAVSVVASVPGEGMYWSNFVATGDDDVVLQPSGGERTTLTLRVDGLPAEAASRVRVELRPNDGDNGLPPPWDQVALDAAGTMTLRDLPKVPYTVVLRAEGLRFEPTKLTLAAETEDRTLRVRAVAGTADTLPLVVQLRDREGRALEGVLLQARGLYADVVAKAVTDASGIATFCIAAPMRTPLLVTSLDRRWVVAQDKPSYRDPLQWTAHLCELGFVAPGADATTPLPLVAERSATITSRVQLADGSPASRTFVQLTARFESHWLPMGWGQTDADGNLRLDGLRHGYGALRLFLQDPQGGGSSDSFEAPPAGESLELPPMRLEPLGSIHGIVRHRDGKPAAGVRVSLRQGQTEGPTRVVVVDRDGRFVFAGLAAGRKFVGLVDPTDAAGRARSSRPVEVLAGAQVELQLEFTPQ